MAGIMFISLLLLFWPKEKRAEFSKSKQLHCHYPLAERELPTYFFCTPVTIS
jgi:hypothetical protein